MNDNQKAKALKLKVDGLSIDEICKKIRAPKKDIISYINMAFKIPTKSPQISTDPVDEATQKLLSNGFTKEQALKRIKIVMKRDKPPKRSEDIFNAALLLKTPIDELIVTKTSKGKSGVAVMTQGGSARGDENRARLGSGRAAIKDSIFHPKGDDEKSY